MVSGALVRTENTEARHISVGNKALADSQCVGLCVQELILWSYLAFWKSLIYPLYSRVQSHLCFISLPYSELLKHAPEHMAGGSQKAV